MDNGSNEQMTKKDSQANEHKFDWTIHRMDNG